MREKLEVQADSEFESLTLRFGCSALLSALIRSAFLASSGGYSLTDQTSSSEFDFAVEPVAEKLMLESGSL